MAVYRFYWKMTRPRFDSGQVHMIMDIYCKKCDRLVAESIEDLKSIVHNCEKDNK